MRELSPSSVDSLSPTSSASRDSSSSGRSCLGHAGGSSGQGHEIRGGWGCVWVCGCPHS